MKKVILSFFLLGSLWTQAQFTQGKIVVSRVGNSSTALGANTAPVSLLEFAPTGTGQTPTPIVNFGTSTVGSRLTLAGTTQYEGQLNLSSDGRYLSLIGYDVPSAEVATNTAVSTIAITSQGTGYSYSNTITISGGGGTGATAIVGNITSGGISNIVVTNGGSGYTSAPTVTINGAGSGFVAGAIAFVPYWQGQASKKTIAKVDYTGATDYSTNFVNSAHTATVQTSGVAKGVTSVDGSKYWISGSKIEYVAFGQTSAATLAVNAGPRSFGVFKEQLYYMTGFSSTGFPYTTPALPTSLVSSSSSTFATSSSASYGQFTFLDTDPTVGWNGTGYDVLYVAENTAGLEKFYFDGTNWQPVNSRYSGSLNNCLFPGAAISSITATINSSGNPVIYAIGGNGTATNNSLYSITDAAGRTTAMVNGTNTTVTTLGTSGANYAFKGVALSPVQNAYTWVGNISTNFNVAGNFYAQNAASTTRSFYVPSGLTNYPIVTTATTVNGGTIAAGASLSASAALTNNGTIIFKSDATGTASLGNSAGAVTGNVTVERYIPSNGRKNYTMVTSPVSGSTIKTAWQEAGATVSGYGTQITGGTVGNAAANGFDTTSASGLSSIYTYNDANASGSKWVGLANTNVDTLGRGKGYLLYVRGDRAEARNITGTSSNTTLRATGTLTTGNFTPVLTTTLADKFNLVANPYASAITWTGLTKTNLTGSFYVFDPNVGIFFTSNGTTVSPVAPGIGTTQQRKDTIQSGQAFFIQNASTGTPSITFTESAKVGTGLTASANTVFGGSSIPSQLNINLYNKSNELTDGVVALFGNDYKAGVGKEDAAKMDNLNETFSLTRNNNRLSIEGRPMIKGNDTLFFAMSNFNKKEYVLQIDGSNFSEANATLVDNYSGTKTPLDLAGTTAYNFAVNGDAASAGNDRFIITFGSTATTIAAGEIADNNNLFVKVGPNPVINQLQVNFKTATTANTVIKVINSLGQTVRTINAGKVNAGNVSIPAASLSAGLYTVQLISGDKKIAVQKIVKQ